MNRLHASPRHCPPLSFFSALSASSAVFFCSLLFCTTAKADMFGSGANLFSIEFVTIGEPGNAADTTGDPNPAGAVPHEYRIGKYESSAGRSS